MISGDHICRMAATLAADFRAHMKADNGGPNADLWSAAIIAGRRAGVNRSPSVEEVIAAALGALADRVEKGE